MLTHGGGDPGRCTGKPADVVSVVTVNTLKVQCGSLADWASVNLFNNKITRSSSYFQQDLRRTGSDTLAQSVACLATEPRVPVTQSQTQILDLTAPGMKSGHLGWRRKWDVGRFESVVSRS
uniref:Uncharacterized protein n=1 Tax=Timema cristinae TaxID=61476 RepID=A0A7R9CV82_TIMCR|nr:unnamed protein product [Timema cristinae]